MRNPKAPGWPDDGERTSDRQVAERWKWAYHDHVRHGHRSRVLGQKRARTLGDAVTEYLRHRENVVEYATWSNDRSALGHLLDAVGAAVPTVKLAPDSYQVLADRMLSEGYQASTVAVYMGQIGAFAKWAGMAEPDVDLPNPGTTDRYIFTDEECDRLRWAGNRVDEQRIGKFPSARLAVEIGLSMGLRQGEMFALRWQEIDREARSVRVNWQVPKDRHELKPLKGKQARTALVLPEWWGFHRDDATGVILSHKGRTVSTRTQRNLITRVLDTAGLNDIGRGFHELRHAYARRFLERAPDIFLLMKSLGHSSVTITEQAYEHLLSDRAVELARKRVYG